MACQNDEYSAGTGLETLYRSELHALARVEISTTVGTPMFADNVLDAARRDAHVRELVIHALLPLIHGFAIRFCRDGVDVMDLIGTGNLAVIERWDEAMLKDVPTQYLLNHAKMVMLEYVRRFGRGPITFITGGRLAPNREFVQIIDDVDSIPSAVSTVPMDLTPLHAALASLPEASRSLLIQRFGLDGQEAKALEELAGSPDSHSSVYVAQYMRLRRSLIQMQAFLIAHYPDFVKMHVYGDALHAEACILRKRLEEIPSIPSEVRARLDAAKLRIEARGETLSHPRIQREVTVGALYISAYLYEIRLAEGPLPSVRARMETARLQIEARGEKVTRDNLRKEAKISCECASAYLHEIRERPEGKIARARLLYQEANHSIDGICSMLKISRPTFFRYVRGTKTSSGGQTHENSTE
jgi:DNA-directed RNA polymerase specialized sigma24 family protein